MKRLMAAAFGWACMGLCAPASAQEPPPFDMTSVTIAVRDNALSGRLYAPSGRADYPVVVLVSGSGNESEVEGVYTRIIAGAFAAQGIGTLAYDKRGVGGSSGTYTGNDFRALGDDAAAVARFASRLPQVEAVGMWGISQAGWIIPYAVRRAPNLRFAILVSAAGVNPHEQVSYFLRTQALSWGLTPEEADAADAMHRAVALYYAGRARYEDAQAEVDRHQGARWFGAVVTHPYWDEMSPEGAILNPERLSAALRERPGAFEIYSSPSSFVDYARTYRSLRRLPTLFIYGSADELVPPARSRAIFEATFAGERRHAHEFRVFDGASHDIQTPEGRVRQDYLDTMSAWARAQFDVAG